jgi:ABC-type dipeptide/oligopeptide/nickel transport system permease subunit
VGHAPRGPAERVTAAHRRIRASLLLLTAVRGSLSFLGLGVQPPDADWGSMVHDNATAINLGKIAPLVPAAAIAVLTVGINLVVDWFLSIHARAHGERA